MAQLRTRRNVFLLALSQALFMTSTSAIITSAALVGLTLAEHKGLSTIPVAFQYAATMAVTIPGSLYMKRVGRRTGFITGAAIGIFGAVLATVAIIRGDFWLFAAGAFCIGCFNGIAQFFRFAAAEVATPEFRGRAISLVLAGGIVAAVTGPNMAQMTRELIPTATFAGIYAAIAAIYLAVIAVMTLVRFPPRDEAETTGPQRPLGEIVRQGRFVVAATCAIIAYLVMSFLMTISPVAMNHIGYVFRDSAIVIQFHILGMFIPSFFTGTLIDRFGAPRIMLAGGALQALCIAINLSGTAFANFGAAMFLVGVGWNFLFIGATTLLTDCYTPAEKAKAQGFNDFCIWGFVMLGAFTSGPAHAALGWSALNIMAAPLVALAIGAILWLRLADRRITA